MKRFSIRSRPPSSRTSLEAPGQGPRVSDPTQAVTDRPGRVERRPSQQRAPVEYHHPIDVAGRARATPLLQFTCQPGTDVLEVAHQFIEALAGASFRPGLAARLTIAGYELLANALAYGSLGRDVQFELVDLGDRVAVRVSNEAVAALPDLLVAGVGRLQRDPQAVFLEEMRRYATQGIQRAMLGLARVRHEAAMNLDCQRSGSRVTVSASLEK